MPEKVLSRVRPLRNSRSEGLSGPRFERALSALREIVVARRLHMTTVRATILRAALELRGHFDAPLLARAVRDRGHSVSLTAIYRNLPLMIEAGLIRPTLFSQGESGLYEAAFELPDHDHLVCRACGAVVEFQSEAFAAFRRDVAAMHAFELASHVHEVIGVCTRCRPDPAR